MTREEALDGRYDAIQKKYGWILIKGNGKMIIDLNELEISHGKISDILYDGASAEIKRERIAGKKFMDTLEKVKNNYLSAARPAVFVKETDPRMIREIFAESLDESSPIYKSADLWQYAAIFIATIGGDPESSIKTLTDRGSLFEALLLDAACSVLVDNLAEKTEKKWASEKLLINEGKYYSTRYSPGYCGWNVRGQTALFGYMADLPLPVSLTEGGMMHPRKSISGVLVIEESEKKDVTMAGACRMCSHRCRNLRIISI